MSARDAHTFIGALPADPIAMWDNAALDLLGAQVVPSAILRGCGALLRADQTNLWSRWFMEGLAAPARFASDPSKTSLHVFEVVLRTLDRLFSEDTPADRRKLANAIAGHLYAEVERQRQRGRKGAHLTQKRLLIRTVTTPRCYLCGYSFTHEAIDNFLKVAGADPIRLPRLVDILRPRGLKDHQLSIEVEHVVPVASGGSAGSNLRLACGWCNRAKGAKSSIYEAAFTPRSGLFQLGGQTMHQLPEPFWTVRTLAVQGCCQHSGGCSATNETHELFVALRDPAGSPNPTNLGAFCAEHDPFSADRFQERDKVEAVWTLK